MQPKILVTEEGGGSLGVYYLYFFFQVQLVIVFFNGNGMGWPLFLLFTSTIYSP